MERNKPGSFESSDESETSPSDRVRSGTTETETIDLGALLATEVTESGSFNVGSDIWASAFGKVMQALPIAILLIDRMGNVVIANAACERIGIPFETIGNRPFCQLFSSPAIQAKCVTTVQSVFDTRKGKTWEAALATYEGNTWGRVTLRSIRVKGQRFLLGVVEDLSLEMRLRQQEQRYSEQLEKQVKARTQELTKLNAQLLEEIDERKRSEESAQESGRRFLALFEQAAIGVALIDTESGTLVKVNRRFADIVGYTTEELRSISVPAITHPDDLPASLDSMARLTSGELREFSCEKRYVRKDGSAVWVNLTASPMWQPGDRPDFHIVVVEDISERKKAEQALRESEERFRAVFESDHAVLLLIDPDTGRIEDASPGACSFYGFSRHEIRGKYISDFNVLPTDKIDQQIRRAKSQRCKYFDFRHRLASGELRDVEVCSGPIVNAGRTLLFSIIHDVTEQKRAQDASLQSEKKYRALFDESKDGVYSVLRNGEITDVNPAFLEMFGYARDEMIGKNIRDLYVDPLEEHTYRKEIEKKGYDKDYEVNLRKKDGTEISCLLTSSLQSDEDGGIVGYRGIIRDLTVRKQLQRQLFHAQKMEAIGTLAGGIAHDFNNLLTVIIGFSELLLMGKDEQDPAYADLRKIHRAARSGADLIDRILTFSRKTEINPRSLDLNREIEHVKKMLTRTIPKMVQIQVSLCDNLGTVNADPTQVEQILMNLAVNAKDAMPEGGTLTISTANVTLDEEYCRLNLGVQPGDYVMLSVVDTGEGMGPETLQHIFEPFYTTKGSGHGTGLGLAMVYGIVEQHGGHITCSSELGAGTSFNIYLPVITDNSSDKQEHFSNELPQGTETILLVDDEDMVRDLGKKILQRSGYCVATAANGKEALKLYEEERSRIGLVILDLIMPEMGGKQCLEELLKIDPQVKVIIASGYSPESYAGDLVQAARAVVGKPYDMSQLLRTVREVLDQKSPQ